MSGIGELMAIDCGGRGHYCVCNGEECRSQGCQVANQCRTCSPPSNDRTVPLGVRAILNAITALPSIDLDDPLPLPQSDTTTARLPTTLYGPSVFTLDEPIPLPVVTHHPDQWADGYRTALQDVLKYLETDGKQQIVQWTEGMLKALTASKP